MSGLLKITAKVDDERTSNIECVITNDVSEYTIISDNDGYCEIILSDGVWTITSNYLNDPFNYTEIETLVEITNEDTVEISINHLNCNKTLNEVLLDKTCKYFHHEPYMTPNNYDLYFDYRNIPVNIKTESPLELHRRLQRYLPLTKILHLNLDTHDEEISNTIHITNNLNLHYKTLTITKDNNTYTPNITLIWDDNLLTELLYNNLNKELIDDLNNTLTSMGLSNSLNSDSLNNLIIKVDNAHENNLNYTDKTLISTIENEESSETEEIVTVIENYNTLLYDSLNDLITQSIGETTDEKLINIGKKHLQETLTETEYNTYDNIGFLLEGNRFLNEQINLFIDRQYNNFYDKSIDDYKHSIGCNLYSLEGNSSGDDITYVRGLLEVRELLFNNNDGEGTVKGEYSDGKFQLKKEGTFTNNEDALSDTTYLQGLLDLIIHTEYSDSSLVGFNIPLNKENTWTNTVNNTLKIFPVLPDGELDYNRIKYELTHYPSYKIYTCKECGTQYYSSEEVTMCSDCEKTEFEITTPYSISFNEDIIDYTEDVDIKII